MTTVIALGITALVSSIVSSLSGATHLTRSYRRERQEREEARILLERSFVCGGRDVQSRYAVGYAAYGQMFEFGDAQARMELLTHLTVLQSAVISILTNGLSAPSSSQSVDFDSMRTTSDDVRQGVLNSLLQQCQRLSQSAPLRNCMEPSSSTPERRACTGPWMRTMWQNLRCQACRATCPYGHMYPNYFVRHEYCEQPTEISKMWFICDFCPEAVQGNIKFLHHRRECLQRMKEQVPILSEPSTPSSGASTSKLKNGSIVMADRRLDPVFASPPLSPSYSRLEDQQAANIIPDFSSVIADIKAKPRSIMMSDTHTDHLNDPTHSTAEPNRPSYERGSIHLDVLPRGRAASRSRPRAGSQRRAESNGRDGSSRRGQSRKREAVSICSKPSIISVRPLLHKRSLSFV